MGVSENEIYIDIPPPGMMNLRGKIIISKNQPMNLGPAFLLGQSHIKQTTRTLGGFGDAGWKGMASGFQHHRFILGVKIEIGVGWNHL